MCATAIECRVKLTLCVHRLKSWLLCDVQLEEMVLTRKSAARPTSLDLDNALTMDMDGIFPDMDNNNLHQPTQNSRKKRRRAADIPVKRFLGKPLLNFIGS